MRKNKIILPLFIILCLCSSSFAQPSASQIERSQELLDREQALRQELEKGEKTLIKKIIVKGARRLTKKQIRQIVTPFQKHWLTKKDFEEIIDLIKGEYKMKGYRRPIKVSYAVKSRTLIIRVVEPKKNP